MRIIEEKIKIKDIFVGYRDDTDKDQGGIIGYSGRLDIRPPYQRNFVYNIEQSRKVIYTILNKFPLNLIYFVTGTNTEYDYELLDGQQRIISICKFMNNEYAIYKDKTGKSSDVHNIIYFENMTKEEQENFKNYELSVYVCTEGTSREKLDWFEVINTAGEKLNKQEIRNAIYNGPWVTDAKKYFSKINCVAYNKGKDYMSGDVNRQDYLETTIKWISGNDITEYMAKHQHDKDANQLWIYFQSVIDWIQRIFPDYRKEMKGLPWGEWYNKFKNESFNSSEIAKRVDILMADPEIDNHKGIYEYILTGEEKCLNLRNFDEEVKRSTYEIQNRKCNICQKEFEFEVMHGDHIKPWSKGGKTIPENCQMLCRDCNLKKSNQVQD